MGGVVKVWLLETDVPAGKCAVHVVDKVWGGSRSVCGGGLKCGGGDVRQGVDG